MLVRPTATPASSPLTRHALAGLTLRRSFTDSAGLRNLATCSQCAGSRCSATAFRATSRRGGRLLQLDGSPLAHLPRQVGKPRPSAPLRARRIGAPATHSFSGPPGGYPAVQSVPTRSTAFRNGDRATLVLFNTTVGASAQLADADHAQRLRPRARRGPGRTLYRRNIVQSDSGDVWTNYPARPRRQPADDQPDHTRLAAEQLPAAWPATSPTCTWT